MGLSGRVVRILACASVACCALAFPGFAATPELEMLSNLQKGSWEIRMRETGTRTLVCVRSGSEFIQLRHNQPNCTQMVLEDLPARVVVQYTCPDNGYGRTTIRGESSRLVQIQSQGIANGAPFQFSAEARRVSNC